MSSIIGETSRSSFKDDESLLELEEKLKVQRKRYIRNKLLHDLIRKLCGANCLENNLSEKVKDLLIFQDALEVIGFNEPSNPLLFGLKMEDLTPSELSYKEQCKVNSALEGYFLKFFQNFKTNYSHLIEANLCTNVQNKLAKELKEKLILRQQEDIKDVTETSLDLNEIIRLRTEELPVIISTKLEEYELKVKVTYAKYKVLQYKVKVSVFTEVDKCTDAYKELINDIQKQQEVCRKNIEDLTLLKEKYIAVRCKEFNSILESYLQYKSQVEAKCTLLSKISK